MRERLTLTFVLLLVWTGWISVVWTTNVCDLLRHLGVLPSYWGFASGNLAWIISTTRIYGVPEWLNMLLFVGVIVWEGLMAIEFWRAVIARNAASRQVHARSGFILGVGLFGAFTIADEIFLAYDTEATHFRIFLALLASALVASLLEPVTADQPVENRPR